MKILKIDPYLTPHRAALEARLADYQAKRRQLAGDGRLSDFANGYRYFGMHPDGTGWVYREWAPAADAMYLTGDFNGWDTAACPMERKDNGVWEVHLPHLTIGEHLQAIVWHEGQMLRRMPSYATRVVQDPNTYAWCAVVDDVLTDSFGWTDEGFKPTNKPIIYECHIGMAQEEGKVGSYEEFRQKILPRIKKLGYNTIQIMAVMEHPYYGSFGYQVSNFYAPSSRYGRARELKRLINEAHAKGITVLLDVVHSHAVKNTNEGLNLFDGTEYQYFHEGAKGHHPAWDTKLFHYDKNEVLHFLLSNLKYWMEIFHFDGFRFDGVTSMLYHDHGLGQAFVNYDMYFSENTDREAVTYLMLANELVHEINPRAITVAEDMSGMPGMALPIADGGLGFDYRLSMGVPDLWIELLKEYRDEDWDMYKLWYELTSCRPKEKSIGYCESHDQALVGDKTILFRLCDAEMYWHMDRASDSPVIARGVALHKMIRLLTATVVGEGYLNFMGNEFGHPEWVDFPREGNGWSYHYCRRQWSLADHSALRYGALQAFDAAMVKLLKQDWMFKNRAKSQWIHQEDKVLIYSKKDAVFAFNFHPSASFSGYFIPVEAAGVYRVSLTTDASTYDGLGRVDLSCRYTASKTSDGRVGFFCNLPCRCAIVFEKEKKSLS